MVMTDVKSSNQWNEREAFERAVGVIIINQRVSTSYIQRQLGISYNNAARLVEMAEVAKIIAPANHIGKREVLLKIEVKE